jgi:acyl carrier protein
MSAVELEPVLEIVRAHLPPSSPVSATSRAAEVAGWDSVAMVDILFAVEEAFGVEFSSGQMERADGVPSLLALLSEARSG